MYRKELVIVIRRRLVRFGVAGYDRVLELGQRRQRRRLSLVLDPAPYSRRRFIQSHALKRCTEPATKVCEFALTIPSGDFDFRWRTVKVTLGSRVPCILSRDRVVISTATLSTILLSTYRHPRRFFYASLRTCAVTCCRPEAVRAQNPGFRASNTIAAVWAVYLVAGLKEDVDTI